MFRDCPKDQLLHCFQYEFAREHEETRKWMEWAGQKLADNATVTPSDLLAEFPCQTVSQYPAALFYTTTGQLLLATLPHFPQQPWLDLPVDLRDWLSKKFWTNNDRITGEETFTDYGDPELLIEPLGPSTHSTIGEILQRSGFTQLAKQPNAYLIVLDWSQSDKRLIQRFALWLRRNTPTSRRVVEARGRRSPSDLLKQLAALRLSKGGVRISVAASFAEDRLGEPLYANEQVWSKQRKKAAKFISEEFAL